MDLEKIQSLETPENCVADFCLIPIGTPTASVSQEVADVQRLMKQSKLSYSMHSAGTTVGESTLPSRQQKDRRDAQGDTNNLREYGRLNDSCLTNHASPEGPWDEVMRLIGQAHVMLHKKGVVRIQTDIRVGSRCGSIPITKCVVQVAYHGSRIDKKQSFNDKVTAVNELLAADEKGEGAK
ncbi:MAG: hypothetical protein L6R35_007028 [Caloplaca aegaea]|nr:MAG: hypothetical protein L6R35_007028 [Caloplaca aegaea]